MYFFDNEAKMHQGRGFTLVELLSVMLFITLALTFFASLSSKPDISRRLNTAEHLLHGKLREARGVAAIRQRNARLLIHADQAQPELQWHSVAIVVESEPGSDVWTGAVSFGGQEMQTQTGIGGWQPGTTCRAYEFKPTGRISSLRYDCYLS